MRKRVSQSDDLFNFLFIDAAAIQEHTGLIDDLLHKRLDGVIIKNALPNKAVRHALDRIARGEVAFRKMTFPKERGTEVAPYTFGRAIVGADPAMVEYFEAAREVRAHLRELFEGVLDLEAHIESLFSTLGAGRPVIVPEGPNGTTYAPATLRFLPEGQQIAVHVGNSFLRLPQAEHLSSCVDLLDQLSFFFTLAAPEGGGELVVYGLEWDDVKRMFPERMGPDAVVYDAGNAILPLIELCDKQAYKPGDGDLLLFDGGRYYHRVSHIRGPITRCTLGGFVALSRDGEKLCYWS